MNKTSGGTSAIATPKGGGALSGMGEKFSPDLFTGTGNFSVPIALPPGRNGFQPQLTLGYSTGSGNSSFGLGWSLSVPGITRKTAKGVPEYNDDTDVFILSGAEDLVPVKKEKSTSNNITHTKTFYSPRTEGLFARVVHHQKTNGENYWEVLSKDGLISYYGTPGVLQDDPCVIAKPDNRVKIFAWRLSQTVDPFGNTIVYSYQRELVTSGEHIYDQLYLDTIKYADYINSGTPDFLVQVKFNYTPRPDPFSEYKQGFDIRTTKRCSNIEIYTNASALIKTKTYHFTYLDEISADIPLNGISLLSKVQVEGHDGAASEFLPPLEFKYSAFDPQQRDFYPVEGRDLPARSLGNTDLELVDLTGNGLPDILQMNGVVRYWSNLGNGKFDLPRLMDKAPSLQLGDPSVQMMDADGDGKTDLFVNTGTLTGYFPTRFGGGFDKKSFHKYETAPSFSFHDPEVKLIDLDGDGITDVLRNGSRFECFFNDRHNGFSKTRFINKDALEKFPNVSFADPRIRIADMTGDGMQDIVYIHNGIVEYWPNLGYGNFGKKVTMKNSPKYPFGFDPKRILIGDLDGDGLSDIIYVEDNTCTLWINQSGNSWSNPVQIQGTPSVTDMDALRITDLLGSGVGGVLWSSDFSAAQRGQMFFLDFTSGNKPYLLQEMNNNMGSITKVEYTSSTKFYLEDYKNKNTRWKTDLPFPVLVVSKVEVLDGVSGGKLTTEYSYHHGYWDGGEREFRGFGRVDHRDTETFDTFNATGLHSNVPFNTVEAIHYSPPVETRTWFHLGPVGDEFGDWTEVDFSNEYWQGDSPVLERPQSIKDFLKNLPRRDKRDALRTFRGTVLRSELYALDNTPLQTKPYTVTESVFGLREEYAPTSRASELVNKEGGFTRIFFPFNIAQRTTQWERGNDPMTQFSFSDDYDTYGQPRKQVSVGIPRGFTPQQITTYGTPPMLPNTKYLATYSKSEFIYVDIPDGQYMVNRASQAKSFDATDDVTIDVLSFAKNIFDETATLSIIGHSLNYYDGSAFSGNALGVLGFFGALVRSETLIIPDSIISSVYGSTPLVLDANPLWTLSYPAEFQSLFPAQLGYKYHSTFPYTSGYYTETARNKYDFQITSNPPPTGLLVDTKDPFDNVTHIDYDTYNLLPVKVTDALGMETIADYDYRVLQPKMITDPNLNRVAFGFSPLGLMKESAVLGKFGAGEGDIVNETTPPQYDASTKLEYDFFNFINNGDPVWVKTTKRQFHITDPDDTGETIVSTEYSDGFGRLIQTRTQAEDVIYGNSMFGDSGLPADQTAVNQPAVGVQRLSTDPLNVVVSGWQVYNNKGKVVEKFEPFFDSGFDFVPPSISAGVSVKMFYDPRGQLIRTLNPDDSEQTVIFGIPSLLSTPEDFIPTPWESYTYDANDNAGRRAAGFGGTDPSHINTPKSSVLDALGRVVKTVDRLSISSADDVVMRYEFDIRGNLLKVIDALVRTAFEHKYDLKPKAGEDDKGANVLWTKHIDGGIKTVVYDAAFRPVEMNDAKGSFVLNSYDALHRPIRLWAKDYANETVTLRQHLIYGDSAGLLNPEIDNLNGKLYKHYDEAGIQVADSYDFKGNILHKTRKTIKDSKLDIFSTGVQWTQPVFRVNWTLGVMTWAQKEADMLEVDNYETNISYDALNRAKEMQLPLDLDAERKKLIPTYNNAGALQKVSLQNGIGTTDYATEIAYNAKGQRLMIAFGNSMMTRYVYDSKTFRLSRMKSEGYFFSGNIFTPSAGTTRVDCAYEYDLSGNILKIKDRAPNCGVASANFLDRDFDYDALYRLLRATGREADTLAQIPPWNEPTNPVVNAYNTRAYTQMYDYDKMGNMLSLQHTAANGNFTRNFSYLPNQNILDEIAIGANTYSFDFDVNGNMTRENSNRFFEWDYGDRMRLFKDQSGSSEPTKHTQYLYDASGTRIKKFTRNSGGTFEVAVYIDGVFQHRYELGVSFTRTNELSEIHIMDDRSRIAIARSGYYDGTPFIKYNLEDHLGSSICLDDNSTLIDREEYYPFGETSFGSYGKKRYRYCGKEKDDESGLYYYGARYYSAWTCKFISIDPLTAKYAYLTPYNYAGNKPITHKDIDGMEGSGDKPSSTSVQSSPSGFKAGTTTIGNVETKTNIYLQPGPAGSAEIYHIVTVTKVTCGDTIETHTSLVTESHQQGRDPFYTWSDPATTPVQITHIQAATKAESPQSNAVSDKASSGAKGISPRAHSSNTGKKQTSPSSNNNSPRFQWSPGKPSTEKPSNTDKPNGDGGHDNHLVHEIKEGIHLAADAVKDASEDALEHPMKYGYRGMEKIEEIAKKILGRINIVASVFKYALGGIDLIKSFYDLVKSAFTTGIVKMSQVANVIIGAIKTFGGFAANFALSIFEGTPAFKKTMEFLDKTVYNFGTESFMFTR